MNDLERLVSSAIVKSLESKAICGCGREAPLVGELGDVMQCADCGTWFDFDHLLLRVTGKNGGQLEVEVEQALVPLGKPDEVIEIETQPLEFWPDLRRAATWGRESQCPGCGRWVDGQGVCELDYRQLRCDYCCAVWSIR
ncbi:hypothetical protein GOPIP_044_00780 [Gordonia polyisoprenivorans NBRC 16320 = JCM 10675]|uniref:Uncharacterized protein n=1 Tax=Gordonia polyisoprenivorans TaxID=84595 RepID=A0A846WRR6_9ACTN|nr:hypothetical protein [Gordonia polyisoprenivorans]NKY04368.1 hypothetical protein [Gordonia polyisoprenivorans]GAB23387.1 hypothetical protein GOPIP_044_00780 [Gordonia polyisoprenivorans NBRC 16320 = JCM 10675]